MLTNSKTIKGYKLNGIDGELGTIKEFFFDDKFWTVRYLVVTTGGLFSRKQVLISPYFLLNIDHKLEFINVDLTKDEIENSPSVESDKPVSRQFEESYYDYYDAPVYWGGSSMWGTSPTITHRGEWKSIKSGESTWNPNLRSSKDVTGHNIHASDDEIGHVDDFIIDDETWAIRYIVVDTRDFLPGKKVLISPQWIDRIDDSESRVHVDLTSEAIREAPEFDEDEVLTRDYESSLYQHYNRHGYWIEEPVGSEYSRPGMRSEF
jgi:uncharacterized protein YrrD